MCQARWVSVSWHTGTGCDSPRTGLLLSQQACFWILGAGWSQCEPGHCTEMQGQAGALGPQRIQTLAVPGEPRRTWGPG